VGLTQEETPRLLVVSDEADNKVIGDLLSAEGYKYDCATCHKTAKELLVSSQYEVVIADTELVGNPENDPLLHISDLLNDTQIILTTNRPSITAAINSMRYGVIAYMPKPLDNKELLEHVKKSVVIVNIQRTIQNSKRRLKRWHHDLTKISDLVTTSCSETSSLTIDAFLTITISNILASMLDIKNLITGITTGRKQGSCQMMNCPRIENLANSLVAAINVLEKTKSSFKSKELGDLRLQLERVVNELTLNR
jgi:FixJ family two-component response regulator